MSKELQLPAETLSATSVCQDKIIQNDDRTDIRLRRQAKNKLKKETMKRAKEEELRRKLYEPKDQRIRVVQRTELDKMRDQSQITSAAPACIVPIINASDFPSLGKSRTPERTKNIKKPHVLKTPETLGEWPLIAVSTSVHTESHAPPTSQDLKPSTSNYIPPRKPKRNAPIKIEVLSALKKSKAVAPVQSSKPKMKKDSPQLAGNQLDSSNPTRNKGKKREVPKDKKPTNLKLVILQEREIKRLVGKDPTTNDDNVLVEGLLNENNNVNTISEKETGEPPTKDEHNKEPSDPDDTSKLIAAINEAENEDKTSSKILEMCNIHMKEKDQSVDLTISANCKIHSRKFREYCNHVLSSELDVIVSSLVKDIVKFQDRLYFNDPIKAHAKRRFVLGFRETKKYLDLKKIKLLIIAPDLERVQSAGGIDDTVEELKAIAAAQDVPCIFALGRKILKKLTNKSFKISGISCMGVLNYEGTQDNFNSILTLLPKLCTLYQEKINQSDQYLQPQVPDIADEATSQETEADVNSEVVASFLQKLTTEISKK